MSWILAGGRGAGGWQVYFVDLAFGDMKKEACGGIKRVADMHHFSVGRDPAFHSNAEPYTAFFIFMRIPQGFILSL